MRMGIFLAAQSALLGRRLAPQHCVRCSSWRAVYCSAVLMRGCRSDTVHLIASRSGGDRASKENLKKGFLILDISGTPLRARKGPGLSTVGGGSPSPVGPTSR
jgi:hypothetical protein